MGLSDTKSRGFKLKLCIACYRAVTEDEIMRSFTDTGLWPMDYRFLKRFDTGEQRQKEGGRRLAAHMHNAGIASRLPAVKDGGVMATRSKT